MPLMALITVTLLRGHPWPNQIFLTHEEQSVVTVLQGALKIHCKLVMNEAFSAMSKSVPTTSGIKSIMSVFNFIVHLNSKQML